MWSHWSENVLQLNYPLLPCCLWHDVPAELQRVGKEVQELLQPLAYEATQLHMCSANGQ